MFSQFIVLFIVLFALSFFIEPLEQPVIQMAVAPSPAAELVPIKVEQVVLPKRKASVYKVGNVISFP